MKKLIVSISVVFLVFLISVLFFVFSSSSYAELRIEDEKFIDEVAYFVTLKKKAESPILEIAEPAKNEYDILRSKMSNSILFAMLFSYSRFNTKLTEDYEKNRKNVEIFYIEYNTSPKINDNFITKLL